MKCAFLILSLIMSSQAHAIALNCEGPQQHASAAQVVAVSDCDSGLRVIVNSKMAPCAKTIQPVEPGVYQMCYTYDDQADLLTIVRAVDSRLRSLTR